MEPLFRFLDTAGNGTGTKDAIGDYSSGQKFWIGPPAGKCYVLHRCIVQIRDTANPSADGYGNLAALTNGIEPSVTINGTKTDLSDGLTVKTNATWGRVCFDVKLDAFGSGNDFISVRWTFSKSGQPFILYGDDSDRFDMLLQDNLTGLVGHTFQVQGYVATDGVDYNNRFRE